MKKIFLLLTAVAGMALTQSCEGDAGPQGPQGEAGYSAEAAVYELTGVNFVAPSYGIFYTFPQPILASDHILVYRLSGTDNGNDVWQLLPQTYYFTDGTKNFFYNYDFTANDANVYIDRDQFSVVSDQYSLNQVLRFVSVPGYFANKINATNYNTVTKTLKLTDADFKKASSKASN